MHSHHFLMSLSNAGTRHFSSRGTGTGFAALHAHPLPLRLSSFLPRTRPRAPHLINVLDLGVLVLELAMIMILVRTPRY